MSSITIPRPTRHHSRLATASESKRTTARHNPCAAAIHSEKITDGHLQRLALVYVRQSTQHQVLEHRESICLGGSGGGVRLAEGRGTSDRRRPGL